VSNAGGTHAPTGPPLPAHFTPDDKTLVSPVTTGADKEPGEYRSAGLSSPPAVPPLAAQPAP